MSVDSSILTKESANVNKFSLILQGNSINTLQTVSDKSFNNGEYDIFNKTHTIIKNGVTIKVKNLDTVNLNAVTFRFLDYLLYKLCKNMSYSRIEPVEEEKISKFYNIRISTTDFMNTIDTTDRNNAKKQISNSLTSLQNISLSWSESIKKKKKTDYINFDTRIVTNFESDRGGYIIQFDLKFLRYLSSYAYLMPFNMEMFKINLHKYPHSYHIARRLLLHHNMNQNKTNKNTISVKSLLESLNLLTYRDVINKGRQIKQLIINPFERDINYLKEVGILSEWNYQNQNPANYREWSKSNISFIIKSYPTKNDHK